MKLRMLVVSAIGMIASANLAHPATLSGSLTVDNFFFAYVSTSDSTLGTLVASGADWPTTVSLSQALTPGVTNYLHIEAINEWGPAMFVGQFSLDNTLFMFANGTQSLLTDTPHWSAIFNNTNNSATEQTWVMPTGGGVTSFGPNDGSVSTPWGLFSDIDSSAQFIWSNALLADPNGACGSDDIHGCTVDFSTPITLTTPSAVPLPGALPLFASGLVGLGLLGWRRQRRAVAA